MFVIDLRNSTIRNYNFSTINNKNVDVVHIYSRFAKYVDKHVYVKILGENFADKILIDSEHKEVKDGCLIVKWTMGAIATYDKKVQVQLQFEDVTNDLIDQSMIVTITLADTLDVIGQVPPPAPAVLQQILDDISALQGHDVADMSVGFESGLLTFTLYNIEGDAIHTYQVELPTEECYVGATWNVNNNQKIILTKNNGQTTELDLSNIFSAIADVQSNLDNHKGDKDNPHEVTKAQVGLGNADNTSDADKPVSTAQQQALDLKANKSVVDNHIADVENPHSVTKAQVGLGDVVNTGDSATPTENGTTKFTTGGAYTELNKKVDKVQGKGLSTNDYTDNEKNKLEGIEAGAQVNKLEGVQVNGTDLTIENKKVNIDLTGKVDKVSGLNKVYGTDGSGEQTSFNVDNGSGYSGNVARRDSNGQVQVPQTPTANDHATSKKYVDDKIADISRDSYKVVDTTIYPTLNDFLASSGEEGYLYLYPIDTSDLSLGYYRYIWENNAWLDLGTTQIDLSDYYTKTEADTLLGGKQNTIDSNHKLASDLVDDTNQTNKFVTQQQKDDIASNTSARHTHSNKAILDDITSAFTTEQATKLSNIEAYAEVNDIIGVQVNGVDLTIDANRKVNVDLTSYATTSWVNSQLDLKADKSTTYTKTETDTLLNAKEDKLPTRVNGKFLRSTSNGDEWANVVQDLTANALTTLTALDWESFKNASIIQPSVSFSGVDSNYDFIRVKLTINSNDYTALLSKNGANNYVGELGIMESGTLNKVNIYFNGSNSLVLTCLTISDTTNQAIIFSTEDILADSNGNELADVNDNLLGIMEE